MKTEAEIKEAVKNLSAKRAILKRKLSSINVFITHCGNNADNDVFNEKLALALQCYEEFIIIQDEYDQYINERNEEQIIAKFEEIEKLYYNITRDLRRVFG